MKIAFIGDSFCHTVDNGVVPFGPFKGKSRFPSWPYLIAQEFNAKIICKGEDGQSVFWAYETLIHHFKEADYIVFCVTGPGRVPNKWRIPLVQASTDDYITNPTSTWTYTLLVQLLSHGVPDCIPSEKAEKIVRTVGEYYKNLYCDDFHRVSNRGILMQMDDLLLQCQQSDAEFLSKKKIIYLPCFNNSLTGWQDIEEFFFAPDENIKNILQPLKFKSGPVGNISLGDISKSELAVDLTDPEVRKIFNSDGDPESIRINHLNEKNNINLANMIIDTIKNDNFSPGVFKMEKYFPNYKSASNSKSRSSTAYMGEADFTYPGDIEPKQDRPTTIYPEE